MTRLPYADIVGLCGLLCFGMWVNLAQLIKILKTKSVAGVSIWTYRLLFIYVCMLLYCAIGTSFVFILSNIWAIVVNGWVLILFKKYGGGK